VTQAILDMLWPPLKRDTVKSVIEIEIGVPQARLATLYADPQQNTKWMDDIERMESIRGQLGMPGSKYRLVPKSGDMVFVATVLAGNLPAELHLSLEATNVTISVKGRFTALSPRNTRLRHEQVFCFKGLLSRVFGFLAQRSIKKAQRRHVEAFKRFAESQK
jgi:hypothetical protein